jgi:hypothetical protein
MTTIEHAEHLKQYHLQWCELTGNDPNVLRYHLFERSYYDLNRNGFTLDDLKLVVKLIIRQNLKYSIKRKLTIRAVIDDLPRFCEDLAEAKRLQALNVTPRERAIGELRGSIPARAQKDAQVLKELLKRTL